MLVRDVIALIAREVPLADASSTVDTIKLGTDGATIQGIVCAFMPTVDLLRQAAHIGANFVIVHEPVFYNHTDESSWLTDDAVFSEKRTIAQKAGITLYRFHDAPHRVSPDMIREGVAEKLGWKPFQRSAESPCYDLPEASLAELAAELKARLGITTLRVVGDLDMRCRRVALIPGFGGGRDHILRLADETVDVLVAGEGHEWEASEYARDARALGQKKAIIYLGHACSEDAGMEAFAAWLRKRLPGVPVTHVPTASPFTFV